MTKDLCISYITSVPDEMEFILNYLIPGEWMIDEDGPDLTNKGVEYLKRYILQ